MTGAEFRDSRFKMLTTQPYFTPRGQGLLHVEHSVSQSLPSKLQEFFRPVQREIAYLTSVRHKPAA